MGAALALHEWNLALGKVVMADVAHFELALSNAYARVLRDLCHEAHERLFGDNPAPADVEL